MQRQGLAIEVISNMRVVYEASRAKDVLGRGHKCFLSQFVRAKAKKADILIAGRESNYRARLIARMNLDIRGIDTGQIMKSRTCHNDDLQI